MLALTTSLPPGHTETWPLRNSLSLRGAPGAVPHARRFASGTIENWSFRGQILDDVKIVTSELVTNAVQACQGDRTVRLCRVRPITLQIRSNFAAIVIEVADPLSQPPKLPEESQELRARIPESRPEHGWGLGLVSLFSSSWGFYMTDDGKSVWASFTRY
jgi:anti-sigma regulatory factor (Ser/Thr protein kinase)